jgi:EAL domain-containing protein (putative c-di-GMP-specific phosphodiesterase class I)
MDATIRRRKEIERGLRVALGRDDQLEVHYQPLFSARTREVTGAEALLRWTHPELGMISPTVFVPIAESCGLIEMLGNRVLREACRASRGWPIARISVNASAVQLGKPDFAVTVLKIVREEGFDPARLEIEITETSFIENAQACEPNLAALRNAGVSIALDDFGTGYSSLTHLRHFTIDRIKIDRSFVNGIGSDEEGSAIIRAIVELARASRVAVTAEGVETPEQDRFLARVGCDTLQGYLLARPMPADRIEALFERAGMTVTTA